MAGTEPSSPPFARSADGGRGPALRRVLQVFAIVLLVAVVSLWVSEPLWASRGSSTSTGGFAVVTSTNWRFVGASVCWPPLTTGGVVLTGGSVWFTGVNLAYSLPANVSCTAEAAAVATPGFGLLNDSAPVTVPGGASPWLWVNVSVPSTGTQGPLDLYVLVATV